MKNTFFLFILCLLLTSNAVLAHHSSAPHFDNTIEITLQATVTEWKFVNPHAYIYFDVTEDDGNSTAWRCESSSASALRKRGFTEATFSAGQQLTITGNPARREEHVCFMNSFIFADGTQVMRNDSLPEHKIVPRKATSNPAVPAGKEATYSASRQPNISGYWVRNGRPGSMGGPTGGMAANPQAESNGMGTKTGGGRKRVELTEAGQQVKDNYMQIYDDPSIDCDIANILFGWGHDGHVNSISQDNDKITLAYGYMDFVRTIHLNKTEHPKDIAPSRGGHSIGWWENGVLVVETTGFSPGFLIPLAGIPFSEHMSTIEKFTYNPAEQTLTRRFTATDPLYLASTYSGVDEHIRSNEAYLNYDCVELSGDNNKRPAERSKQ